MTIGRNRAKIQLHAKFRGEWHRGRFEHSSAGYLNSETACQSCANRCITRPTNAKERFKPPEESVGDALCQGGLCSPSSLGEAGPQRAGQGRVLPIRPVLTRGRDRGGGRPLHCRGDGEMLSVRPRPGSSCRLLPGEQWASIPGGPQLDSGESARRPRGREGPFFRRVSLSLGPG